MVKGMTANILIEQSLFDVNTQSSSQCRQLVDTRIVYTSRECGCFIAFDRIFVCLCVYPVRDLTFESIDVETSFLVCRYIVGIFRSSLYIKVIGSRSRSQKQNEIYERTVNENKHSRLKGNLVLCLFLNTIALVLSTFIMYIQYLSLCLCSLLSITWSVSLLFSSVSMSSANFNFIFFIFLFHLNDFAVCPFAIK